MTAITVFKSFQAEVVHSPMDDSGLEPEALRQTIARLRAEGRRIKFLYTIPSFHNPMGVTLPWARRMEVLEIARQNDILVLEDNPYGLLYFDQAPPHAIRSVDETGVIYLGTFSKTLARGSGSGGRSRRTPSEEKLILANEAAVLSPSSFSQTVVSEYLANADWRAQIDTFRGVYRERRDAMLGALAEQLPTLSWTVRRAASTCGCASPSTSTRRRCCRARCEGARRLHAGHRVLRRRHRSHGDAPVVLLPDARLHPGRHPPPRDRHHRRTRAAQRVLADRAGVRLPSEPEGVLPPFAS